MHAAGVEWTDEEDEEDEGRSTWYLLPVCGS
jgi:hypothetical protein